MTFNAGDFQLTFKEIQGNFNKISASLMKSNLEVVEYRRLRKIKMANFEGEWELSALFKASEVCNYKQGKLFYKIKFSRNWIYRLE